jgi:predicted phosphodiesterase
VGRIALISDIHGNLTSLQAILDDTERRSAREVICLGDVAAFGPEPREALQRVKALGCPVIMGNTDAWLLNAKVAGPADEYSSRVDAMGLWASQQLDRHDRSFIGTFVPCLKVRLDDARSLLCFHGSPRSSVEVILATTPDEELADMLGPQSGDVMAGGHTHVPMLRRYGHSVLVNPGSVGLPVRHAGHAPVGSRHPPWAEYALLTVEGPGLAIELIRVPVDVQAVRRAALDSGMPHAESWADDWDQGALGPFQS